MRVNVVSLNVDGIKRSPEIDYPDKLPKDPDVYAEFTQEDARGRGVFKRLANGFTKRATNIWTRGKGLFARFRNRLTRRNREPNTRPASRRWSFFGGGESLVKDSALDGMTLLANVLLNEGATPQNVILRVYVKSSLQDQPKVESGKIALQKGEKSGFVHMLQGLGGMYSKGTTWAKLTFSRYSILFINMHLPVKTSTGWNGKLKNATLGNEYRTKMFKHVLTELRDKVDGNTYVIVGGDLNFRVGPDGNDQLDELLREGSLPIPLKELPFPDGESPSFTCKFKENSNTNCRLTKVDKNIDPLEQAYLDPLEQAYPNLECADEDRILSRCDRFLIHKDRPIRVDHYLTDVLLPKSDHNAIYTSFRIGEQEGGRTRRIRVKRRRLSGRRRSSMN